jgi:L-2-hydroxyglutarate oxidase
MKSIAIVGGGILGNLMGYWLSSLYSEEITLFEREPRVGLEASKRNTGVIHQPFYLDPEKKKIFARSARISYKEFWQNYAKEKGLPWNQVGTLEVAIHDDQDVETLRKYEKWGIKNGMDENELVFLDRKGVKELEPGVKCRAALYCKTDTAVYFPAFTEAIKKDAESNEMKFLPNSEVKKIKNYNGKLEVSIENSPNIHYFDFLINCAGGHSVDIAHMMGMGEEFADLHFRGEYYTVEEKNNFPQRNIYSVPKHPKYFFLDPHFIVKFDGTCEIGPNAVLVSSPTTYHGIAKNPTELFSALTEQPILNKLRLILDRDFLSLVSKEWKSSISKNEMAKRVRQFLPQLETQFLIRQNFPGIRSPVISRKGFEPEAIELAGSNSYHILNFNSPGATGAPTYTAYVIKKMIQEGHLDQPTKKSTEFERIIDRFN